MLSLRAKPQNELRGARFDINVHHFKAAGSEQTQATYLTDQPIAEPKLVRKLSFLPRTFKSTLNHEAQSSTTVQARGAGSHTILSVNPTPHRQCRVSVDSFPTHGTWKASAVKRVSVYTKAKDTHMHTRELYEHA